MNTLRRLLALPLLATTFAEWDYVRGVPVRCQRGGQVYVPQGDRWIVQK